MCQYDECVVSASSVNVWQYSLWLCEVFFALYKCLTACVSVLLIPVKSAENTFIMETYAIKTAFLLLLFFLKYTLYVCNITNLMGTLVGIEIMNGKIQVAQCWYLNCFFCFVRLYFCPSLPFFIDYAWAYIMSVFKNKQKNVWIKFSWTVGNTQLMKCENKKAVWN